jgi:hypothetical protein
MFSDVLASKAKSCGWICESHEGGREITREKRLGGSLNS